MADGDLQSLGEILRQAREARALTLDEVETQTRIRVKYLHALEDGDLSVMPSATHAKGFLRNYAQFLHLDANALVSDFATLTGLVSGGVTQRTAPAPQAGRRGPDAASYTDPADPSAPVILHNSPPPSSPFRPTYITPANRVGPATPRTMAGGSSASRPGAQPWSAPHGAPTYEPPPEEESRPPRSLPSRVMRSNVATGVILLLGFIGIVWFTTAKLSAVSVQAIVPTPESADLIRQISGSATVPATGTVRPTSTLIPSFVGPQAFDRVVLKLSVEQRSWLRVTVDGKVVFAGQAEPGTVQNYEAEEVIVVEAGNAAGLLVTYNGQELGALGERGRVEKRFYTVGGQLTPTPTPTITPTSTPVPSPTSRNSPTPDRADID